MSIDVNRDRTGAMSCNRVLIVDDNELNRSMFEELLRANGYETRHATDGLEGLKAVAEWRPAAVLMDLVMPGMGGMDACREIRAMDPEVRPSILVVSTKDDKETIVEALSSGADDYIVKPINETELLARLRAQLRISDFYREIAEDNRNLQNLLEITSAVSASLDPPEVLRIIVSKVAEVTNAVRCSIVLIVKEDEGYVLASHEDPAISELKLDLEKYPEIKQVIETKTPLALDDIASHPLMSSVKEDVAGLKDMSALIIPIVFDDEVLGTIFLRARRKESGFSVKEVDFCRIVANSSFHAIRNARLFEKLTREKEHLQEVAVRDHLTSLFNHNTFYTRLDEEFERAVRYDTPLAIIMMDIDDFKQINDTYGHRVGDVVLKEIAAMIRRGVRKTDIVARYGGEEFAVIMPHTLLKGALDEAERIRELVASHVYGGLVNENITLSMGVASYPQKGAMNAGDIVTYADDALYKAKHAGKNRVRTADE